MTTAISGRETSVVRWESVSENSRAGGREPVGDEDWGGLGWVGLGIEDGFDSPFAIRDSRFPKGRGERRERTPPAGVRSLVTRPCLRSP